MAVAPGETVSRKYIICQIIPSLDTDSRDFLAGYNHAKLCEVRLAFLFSTLFHAVSEALSHTFRCLWHLTKNERTLKVKVNYLLDTVIFSPATSLTYVHIHSKQKILDTDKVSPHSLKSLV